MKFSKINGIIVLLILSLFSFSNSIDSQGQHKGNKAEKTEILNERKKLKNKDEHISDENLHKLFGKNEEHDKFYNENDKAIDLIKEGKLFFLI